jgi:hypothetical protein
VVDIGMAAHAIGLGSVAPSPLRFHTGSMAVEPRLASK